VPVQVLIDEVRGVVHSRYSGLIQLDDVLGYMDYVRTHPVFSPNFIELSEFDPDVQLELFYNDLAVIADTSRDPFARDTLFILVAPNDVTFGIARMYESLSEGRPNVNVVHSMSEAEQCISRWKENHPPQ
jgi:hypothetical protein